MCQDSVFYLLAVSSIIHGSYGSCQPCTGPGMRRALPCPHQSPCIPCTEGTFSKGNNLEINCQPCKTIDDCKINMEVKQSCTLVEDTVCDCIDGYYLKGDYAIGCIKHSPCDPGFGVESRGTKRTNTVCKACPVGTFSNISSYTEPCIPHTVCTYGVETQGTKTSDNTCRTDQRFKGKIIILWVAIPLVATVTAIVIIVILCRRRKGRRSSQNLGNNDLGMHRSSSSINSSTQSCMKDWCPLQDSGGGDEQRRHYNTEDSEMPLNIYHDDSHRDNTDQSIPTNNGSYHSTAVDNRNITGAGANSVNYL